MESTIQDKKLSHRALFCSKLVSKDNIRGKHILDIGSSDTYWMSKIFLSNKAKFVVAIDPEIKNEIKDNKMESYGSDIFDRRLDKKKFHTAVMFDVIEHIPPHTEIKTFKRVNEVLYKNGIFYLSTPNNTLLMNLLDPAWFCGHRHYLQKELHYFLKKSGFIIVDSGTTGGIFESLRICWLYVQKHILKKRSFTYPQWLWYKSVREFEKPGIMSNWIIAKKE